MRYDRRLPRVLHVLLHMKDAEQPMTSSEIGQFLHTDGSFVRRTMAGLRERGWVSSSRGKGGGWTLTAELEDISLLALYDALGSPPLFALATSEDTPRCLLERAANTAVDRALAAAEEIFRAELAAVAVADLAEDFEERLQELGLSQPVPLAMFDGDGGEQ